MSDPIANAQLELACRIGAVDDIVEALDDGAYIDCNCGAPLFVAIMAGERAAVEVLVERGADLSTFLPTDDGSLSQDDRIDLLMACGPSGEDAGNAAANGGEGGTPVDPKMVGTIDRMIRRKGLGEPLVKKRADDYPAFREALGGIGAEDCHAVVSEFLEALEAARAPAASEDDEPDAVFDDRVFLDAEAERIAEWSTRYVEADEAPPALAKEYVKERKKLDADA